MAEGKDLCSYTRQEFLDMENFITEKPFRGIVIVPTDELHDSGFLCMKFILVNRGEIVGVVSGWSDVMHIDGIGGYGKVPAASIRTQLTKRVGWSVDCLPGSGCLRLFSDAECELEDRGFIGSDFCFYVR